MFARLEYCGVSRRWPCVSSMPVPYFLRQATRSGTLVVHNDGEQTRDYVYVDDVVSAMVAASTAPGIDGLVINIGSGVETSTRALASLVLGVSGSTANVVYNSQVTGGVSRLCANIALAEKKLNYKPSIGLEAGLRLTLQRDTRFKAG